MYLIDSTYFNGKLNLPNKVEVNSQALAFLNQNIEKYVPFYLQELLGFEKFEDLDSHIVGGVLQNTAPQMWLDLVNGVTYTHNDKNYKWRGLMFENGMSKVSLLANFVYLNQYQNSINTSIGQVIVEPKNGANINPSEHLTDIWNEFLEMYQGCSDVNYKGIYNINGTMFVDYLRNQSNSGYVSLVQYLNHFKDVYNVNPPILAFQNRLI